MMEKETKKALKEELTECLKQRDEYLAGWQRAKADFLNYKKEETTRIAEALKYQQEEMILDNLTLLDNFELAQKLIPESLEQDPNVEGLLKIKKQLESILKSQGVEEIKTIGVQPDTCYCEIVAEIEADDQESGIVIEEVQKGYLKDGKVIRPAKVKVTK